MKVNNEEINVNIDIFSSIIFIGIFCSYGFGNLKERIPFYPSQILVYLLLAVSILKLIIKKQKIVIPAWYLIYITLLFLSVIMSLEYFDLIAQKQLINMIFYPLSFYFFIEINGVKKVIKLYLKFCFIICIIAIIQELGYIAKIKPLYDFTVYGVNMLFNTTGPFIRVTSIATEPTWFIYYILPAIYFSIGNMFNNSFKKFISMKKSLIVIIASFLTFSLNGYIAMMLIIGYFIITEVRNQKKNINTFIKIFIMIIFVGCIGTFLENIPSINDRLHSLINLKNGYQSDNLSVFAIISNFLVTKNGFMENPLIGIGFFAHRFNYYNYIYEFYSTYQIYMELNYIDAANMFLRIISEFGIIGIILYLTYFFKYKVKNEESNFRIVNSMAMMYLIIFSLRNGQYNTPIFWLAMILYFCSYIESKA